MKKLLIDAILLFSERMIKKDFVMENDRPLNVAIVAMGVALPVVGSDLDAFWDVIKQGKDLKTSIYESGLYSERELRKLCRSGAWEADRFYHPALYLLPTLSRKYSHVQKEMGSYLATLDDMMHLGAYCVDQAFKDLKSSHKDYLKRTGIILGNIALPTTGSVASFKKLLKEKKNDKNIVQYYQEHSPGMLTQVLQHLFSLEGIAYTLDTACASASFTIKFACDELTSHRADMMIVGGINRAHHLFTQMGFSALGALSFSGCVRSFDRSHDGLLVGEGGGVFILKRLSDALKDQDRIYAVIRGCGISNDQEKALFAPSCDGQIRAMKLAYQQAGLQLTDIDYLECHATGTHLGDQVELASLQSMFDVCKDSQITSSCVLSASKSCTGHLLTGAGASSLTKALLSLKHKTLPMLPNFSDTEELSLHPALKILKKSHKWQKRSEAIPRRFALNAFGLGGSNAHIVFEEFQNQKKQYKFSRPKSKAEPIAIVSASACLGNITTFYEVVQQLKGVRQHAKAFSPIIDHLTIEPWLYKTPPNEFQEMLLQQSLALKVCEQAWQQAPLSSADRKNASVLIGYQSDLINDRYLLRWEEIMKGRDKTFSSDAFPVLNANRTKGALAGILASRFAKIHSLGGGCLNISAGLLSGWYVLRQAYHDLVSGSASSAMICSVDRTSTISQASRTENAFLDGAIAFFLKPLAKAKEDKNSILAVISNLEDNTPSSSDVFSPYTTFLGRKLYAGANHLFLHFLQQSVADQLDVDLVLGKIAMKKMPWSLLEKPVLRSSSYVVNFRPPRFFPLKVSPEFMNYRDCLTFATGRASQVLGSSFEKIDALPSRVRLPDNPLLLCHRILSIDAQPLVLKPGSLVTEHDVLPGAWYLDCGRIPAGIAIESGQADLFLSGYSGIDLRTKGLAFYRLLDAEVTFYQALPLAGRTIRYEISILKYFEQASIPFFNFEFTAKIGDEILMKMRHGCAGFFTPEQLDAGRGITLTAIEKKRKDGKITGNFRPFVPLFSEESYDELQIQALMSGNFQECFGKTFKTLDLNTPCRFPKEKLRLIKRVLFVRPGGRYGLWTIRTEMDIHPKDWFLTCHFIDDKVMPGTLMYECCLHSLRILLMRLGWVAESKDYRCDPILKLRSRLRCRGQVLENTKRVQYEIVLKEIGYNQHGAYAIADGYMFADNRMIVEVLDMCLQHTGLDRKYFEQLWLRQLQKPIFIKKQILEFASGSPEIAFGDKYKIFQGERRLARLPAPPYSYLDRILSTTAKPWELSSQKQAIAEFIINPEDWIFQVSSSHHLPYAVLLETGLQTCGWLAAYMGSALLSEHNLWFRNLQGQSYYASPVLKETGVLRMEVLLTDFYRYGDMIIEFFDFEIKQKNLRILWGKTSFGFFTDKALKNQKGIPKPLVSPIVLADKKWRDFPQMYAPEWIFLDEWKSGVKEKKGGGVVLMARATIKPESWFFKAHFLRDPVMPGSLGLEAFIQLLTVFAAERWNLPIKNFGFLAHETPHEWTYRGQVKPHNSELYMFAEVLFIQEDQKRLSASGTLYIDGLAIYNMKNFQVGITEIKSNS